VKRTRKKKRFAWRGYKESAAEGANVAVAMKQQQTQTDTLLAAVARATCG